MEEQEEKIRLQKYLSECGIASRRKSEEYIINGLVKVNDIVVKELGTKINPKKDKVYFKDNLVNKDEEKIYILLNKPIDYVTTVKDQFNRNIVFDLVKTNKKLVPVGRLDMYTSGALILTNDGEFVNKLTHPKYEKNKTYNVTIKGEITKEDIKKLENGLEIEDYVTSKAKARILKIDKEKDISRVEITIHEGKNKQIRKMCDTIGKRVLALHRSKIEDIDLKGLEIGKWRYLTKSEVDKLYR